MSDDFNWYLFVGDETALPAIALWVETRRPGVTVVTLATLFDASEELSLTCSADWRPVWIHRGNPEPTDLEILRASLADLALPPGDGFVWLAGEANVVRSLRADFVDGGHPKAWIHASAYWQRDKEGAHEVYED